MEDFTVFIEKDFLKQDLLENLESGKYVIRNDDNNIYFEKNGFKDQYNEMQYSILRFGSPLERTLEQYDDDDRKFIESVVGTLPHTITISFSLIRGPQLAASVIEIIMDIIRNKNMKEKVVFQESVNGHIMKFNDFELEWKKNKYFWCN